MSNPTQEKITDLPLASAANFTDILPAVQGYVSPSVLGTTNQETLQQIFNLFFANFVISYAGDPNGNVAGTQYQLLWDKTDLILYVCSTTGNAMSAVWSKCITFDAPIDSWNTITVASTNMITNNGYVVNYTGGQASLTLPTVSSVGDEIEILGISSSGYVINQNAGQQITVAPSQTTTGTGGSLATTNRYDSITLICTVADTSWQVPAGVQGIFTIV